MSKLKYSLRRSFSAYILLIYYQRSDPWVDSNQWLNSQRPQKWSLVDISKSENFLNRCSCSAVKRNKIQNLLGLMFEGRNLRFLVGVCCMDVFIWVCTHMWKSKTGFSVYLDHPPYYCFYLILFIIIVCVFEYIVYAQVWRWEYNFWASVFSFHVGFRGSRLSNYV